MSAQLVRVMWVTAVPWFVLPLRPKRVTPALRPPTPPPRDAKCFNCDANHYGPTCALTTTCVHGVPNTSGVEVLPICNGTCFGSSWPRNEGGALFLFVCLFLVFGFDFDFDFLALALVG